MYNIHIEVPSGGKSRGWDREDEAGALQSFETAVSQIKAWKDYPADVVLLKDGIEVKREVIRNAA